MVGIATMAASHCRALGYFAWSGSRARLENNNTRNRTVESLWGGVRVRTLLLLHFVKRFVIVRRPGTTIDCSGRPLFDFGKKEGPVLISLNSIGAPGCTGTDPTLVSASDKSDSQPALHGCFYVCLLLNYSVVSRRMKAFESLIAFGQGVSTLVQWLEVPPDWERWISTT